MTRGRDGVLSCPGAVGVMVGVVVRIADLVWNQCGKVDLLRCCDSRNQVLHNQWIRCYRLEEIAIVAVVRVLNGLGFSPRVCIRAGFCASYVNLEGACPGLPGVASVGNIEIVRPKKVRVVNARAVSD